MFVSLYLAKKQSLAPPAYETEISLNIAAAVLKGVVTCNCIALEFTLLRRESRVV